MRKKGSSESKPSTLSSGWVVEAAPEETVIAPAPVGVPEGEGAAEQPGALSNVAVMLLGLFGGLFLLYAWGWFTVAQFYSSFNQLTAQSSGIAGSVLQTALFWVAPLAPLAWFGASIALTHRKPTWQLAAALVLGLIVLIPLPLILPGGGA